MASEVHSKEKDPLKLNHLWNTISTSKSGQKKGSDGLEEYSLSINHSSKSKYLLI